MGLRILRVRLHQVGGNAGDKGIIMNWLSSSSGGQQTRTATFPIPFPNQCLNVSISWSKTTGQMDYPCRIISYDRTSVRYVADGSSEVSITAIGF